MAFNNLNLNLSNLLTNPQPSTIFHKKVSFTTVDEITNNPVVEGYNVSNPSHPAITVVPLNVGNKVVVPLTNQTGNGAPFLKFHLPNSVTANTMYVTFCVKNSTMADGYYDYTTGIPSTYRTALKNWIVANNLVVANGIKTKALKFTAYGNSTNKPQEAVTFYITFQGNFTSVVSGPSVPTNTTTTFTV